MAANWLDAGVGKLLPKGLLLKEKVGAAETRARHERPITGSEILENMLIDDVGTIVFKEIMKGEQGRGR